MKLSTFVPALSLCLSTSSAFALISGDQITCIDKISKDRFEIEVTDIGDETAVINVFGDDRRAYNAELQEYDGGVYFTMRDNRFHLVEEINIPGDLDSGKKIRAEYHNGEYSGALTCQKN